MHNRIHESLKHIFIQIILVYDFLFPIEIRVNEMWHKIGECKKKWSQSHIIGQDKSDAALEMLQKLHLSISDWNEIIPQGRVDSQVLL